MMQLHIKKSLLVLLITVLLVNLAAAKNKIFLCGRDNELTGISQDILKKYDVTFIPIIYQYAIDPEDKMELIEEVLLAEIKRNFPSKSDSGICVLDWEGKTIEAITNNPVGSKLYERGIALYIKALRLVKKYRPNVKFGLFGINRVNIYKRDDIWLKGNDKMLPVYKESDILFPQVYHYYPYKTHDAKFDSLYVTDMMSLMLKYGLLLKKPVMPFVWHRYFDTKESISNSEFYNHSLFAVTAIYKTKRADGIILWTGDEFWISTGDTAVKKDQSGMVSANYRKQNLSRYFKLISEALITKAKTRN